MSSDFRVTWVVVVPFVDVEGLGGLTAVKGGWEQEGRMR